MDYEDEVSQLEAKILSLEEEKLSMEEKLNKLQYVVNVFDSETTELIRYMKKNHIKDGEWVKIKWYQIGKWWELGRHCFTYVKNVIRLLGIDVKGLDKLLGIDK